MKAETKTFTVPRTVFEITVEKETENEASLPEYMPNINRLIRVEEQPRIESTDISADKAVLSGKSCFSVLYESDYKGKVYQATFSTDFEQRFDLSSQSYRNGGGDSESDGEITAESAASSAFVGCKLLSPRKLLLKSRDNIRFTARKPYSYETPDKDKASVPTYYKTEKLSFANYRQPLEREYALTETIRLSDGEPSVGEIVFTNVVLSAPSASAEDGRLVINADAFVKTLYENEEGNDYFTKTEIIPLSLNVDDDIFGDATVTFIKLWVPEVSSEKELDEYGEQRLINVSFTVKALINILESGEAEAVVDVFSPGYEHTVTSTTVEYEEPVEVTENGFELEKVFETSDSDIRNVLDVSAALSVTGCTYENNTVTVKGAADISVLGKGGAENKMTAEDFSVTFTETFKSDAPPDTRFTCDIVPSSVSAKVSGKNKLSIKADAVATLCGKQKKSTGAITSSVLTEAGSKESDGKLVIYYPSQGDTLWDVAKRYSASPEDIASRNAGAFSDDESVVKGTKMIIIPSPV